jgi:Fic family protein
MESRLSVLSCKKDLLSQQQPLPTELVTNLREWFRVELTYTSNAIEGNTLTRQETALIVDKGLSVAGKTINEVLEAVGHAKAMDYIAELSGSSHDISEHTVLSIHEHILGAIDNSNAGRYRSVPVRIAGSRSIMPNYVKVPQLMADFAAWLQVGNPDHPAKIAADAHYKLVTIHPFADGNGRTARLLMNLLLMRTGYPAAIIRPEDRSSYLTALEIAQTGGSLDEYYECVYAAVDRSLDIYLDSIGQSSSARSESGDGLLKIGQLAQVTTETVATLRYWTNLGLLHVAAHSPGGYQLYARNMVARVTEIRRMQGEERLPLAEIRRRLA